MYVCLMRESSFRRFYSILYLICNVEEVEEDAMTLQRSLSYIPKEIEYMKSLFNFEINMIKALNERRDIISEMELKNKRYSMQDKIFRSHLLFENEINLMEIIFLI